MSFSPSTVGAEEFFTFNFVRELPAGAAILSAVWTVTVKQGVDPNPANIKVGNPVINGTKVSQKIVPLVNDVQYCFTCIATTDSPEKIPLSDTVWVRSACAQLS